MKKIGIALFVLVLLTASVAYGSWESLMQYYARYDVMEKNLQAENGYDKSTANAIKHATAASDMFTLLSRYVGDQWAEKTVISMGLVNEYIEQHKFPEDRDTAREIMKDLHNNYVGIEAAKVARFTGTKISAFKIIMASADNSTLIVNRIYNPFFHEKEPTTNVVDFGYKWFGSHRNEIAERIHWKMARIAALQDAEPFRVSSISPRPPLVN
jgi:hypothetical protein